MEIRKKIRILYFIIAILVLILAGIYINNTEQNALNATSIITQPYYQIKHSIFEAMNRDKDSIVFLGDSLTDYVKFDEILRNPFIKNRGIAGDTTLGVLNRLDEVISMKPAKLFILIGTNDIRYERKPDEIIQSIRQIISRVQEESKDTKIYVQSLFPVNNIKFKTRRPIETIQAVNAEIKKLADELHCTFIDLYPLLLNESDNALDVKYTIDGLHLNGKGVLKWVEYLKPYVSE